MTTASRPVVPRVNHSSQMIVEDHLKVMMTKPHGGSMWRFYQNDLLPQSQHSVFGDFPAEMTLKQKRGLSAANRTPVHESKKTIEADQTQFDSTVSSLKYWQSPLKTHSSKFSDPSQTASSFAFGSPLKTQTKMSSLSPIKGKSHT